MIKKIYIDNKKKLIQYLTKQNTLIEKKKKINIYTTCRDVTITNVFVSHIIFVYSGRKHVPVKIKSSMLNYKLGAFVYTRKRCVFRSKKKKKKNFKK